MRRKNPRAQLTGREKLLYLYFLFTLYMKGSFFASWTHTRVKKKCMSLLLFSLTESTQREVWGVENCKIMRESVAGIKRQKKKERVSEISKRPMRAFYILRGNFILFPCRGDKQISWSLCGGRWSFPAFSTGTRYLYVHMLGVDVESATDSQKTHCVCIHLSGRYSSLI